jgi:hypothetical protein
MSRGLRVALVLSAIAIFLCCVAGLGVTLLGTRLVGRAVITDPDRAQTVGNEIADYELPTGHEVMFASNIMNFKMVAIGPTVTTSDFLMFIMMQFPAGVGVNREEMERQIEQAMARQTGIGSANMRNVGQEQVVIKDETVTMTVREGTMENGEQLRQISGIFQGKGGPVMLMITGVADTWDQAMVDKFIASIG